jgi:co-chaperonin GroES (HSP10)
MSEITTKELSAASGSVCVQMFGENFLVQPDTAEAMSEGGIFIPVEAREKQFSGTVVAKGPDVPDQIQLGDHVTYLWEHERKLNIGGRELLVMEVSDLACSIHKPDSGRGTMLYGTEHTT